MKSRNTKLYTIKNVNHFFTFTAPFNSRKQLKKIMLDALTNNRLLEKINKQKDNKKLFLFINLENINLTESLQKQEIQLKFKLFTQKELSKLKGKPIQKWINIKNSLTIKNIKKKFGTINCKLISTSNNCIKTTPCICPGGKCKSKHKIFFCKCRDLGDYIQKLNSGKVTMKEHDYIFNFISRWDEFKNHNLDVPILHFK